MAEKRGFSPIGDLLNNSWQIVTNTWSKLLIVSILGAAVVIAYTLLLVILGGGAALGGAALGSLGTGIGLGMFLSLITTLVYVGVFSVFGAATVKIVSQPDSKTGAIDYVKEAFGKFGPIFLVTLVVGVLTIGGMGLLFIPGIAIGILLSFAMYEVIFHNVGVGQAIKNSATIVSRNFGAIAARWLVAMAISLVLGFVMGKLTQHSLLNLVGVVANILVSWFFLAYWYQVYKEARKQTDLKSSTSITWVYVVAIVGWVVIIGFGSLLGAGLARFANNQTLRNSLLQMPSNTAIENYDDLYESYNQAEDSAEDLGVDTQGIPTLPSSGDEVFDSIIDTSNMTPEEQEQAQEAMRQFMEYMQNAQQESAE